LDTLDYIERQLKKAGISQYRLDGTVFAGCGIDSFFSLGQIKSHKRQQLIDSFNKPGELSTRFDITSAYSLPYSCRNKSISLFVVNEGTPLPLL
jgi:hypothetical protein